MRKKKVIIWTDYLGVRTGLARNGKELAIWLYKTGKYEIVYFCCGLSVQHPDFAKYPFKVVGCLPNDSLQMDAINKGDEGYKRHMSYGGGYIDELMKNEKADVLIMLNDSWGGFGGIWDKVWYNKITHLPVITLDSKPFLPDQKTFIEKSKQFYVWTEFAMHEAHRLGYKHVKTIPGILDPRCFFKISKNRKAELRKKLNIPQDAFVIGFVFRNQLRKLPDVLLQGYQLFKKENPNAKAYLLFFTHWSEGAGWDLQRLISDIGVPNENVLTCYICRNCQNYEIKPFTGQDLNCCACGAEKSQTTCNVGVGITEPELNDVYGIMDSYFQVFTNGGLEFPCLESLYCELPMATVPYSSGETFTEQDFVFSIDCTYTLQLGTQFIRAVPSPYSVAKIIKKIYEMPVEKRDEIGAKGRKWALSKFSPSVVGKLYEDIIDAAPFTDYDFKFEFKPKNPDFPFPEITDPQEFVKSLYNNILNCEPDPKGLADWLENIKNGIPKQQIYAYFIDLAKKDNEKAGIGTKKIDDFLEKEDKPRLLLVIKESIGDCIYAKGLIESYQKSYPNHRIYIGTDPVYFEIFEDLTEIRLLPYHPMMESEIAMTGSGPNKGYFDVYTHLTVLSQRHLSYLTNNKTHEIV